MWTGLPSCSLLRTARLRKAVCPADLSKEGVRCPTVGSLPVPSTFFLRSCGVKTDCLVCKAGDTRVELPDGAPIGSVYQARHANLPETYAVLRTDLPEAIVLLTHVPKSHVPQRNAGYIREEVRHPLSTDRLPEAAGSRTHPVFRAEGGAAANASCVLRKARGSCTSCVRSIARA